MAPVIEIEGLRKEYRRLRRPSTVALDGLDLEVSEGGVFGFLGPNGAGKTTTIRCLLGLVAASAGRARLLGNDVPRGLPGVIRRVGSIVEAPALYPRFTGRRNLHILARIDGIAREAVDTALDRVGLTARANDMVRTYSLGMKQRLGIAAALLKDPSLLILDEPANGLDPQGIRWLRDFLRWYASQGRTVLVSSHVLAEMSQTADAVVVIARGKVVAQGPLAELTGSDGGAVEVRSPGSERLAAALRARGFGVKAGAGQMLVVTGVDAATVGDLALSEGVAVHGLAERGASLEDVFFELTGEESAPS
jgi:ABC-2 type transport system ATP-binding protein